MYNNADMNVNVSRLQDNNSKWGTLFIGRQ
jgi:hypothetical protein